jgi:hypothetical protein
MTLPKPNLDLSWKDDASCGKMNLKKSDLIFFPSIQNKRSNRWDQGKKICLGCPVSKECLAEAIYSTPVINEGLWGGLTPFERRTLIEKEKTSP